MVFAVALDVEWGDGRGYRLGHTKVFLKEGVTKALERARLAIWDDAATVIQNG